MKDKILKAVNSPHDLESIYRENPGEFIRLFPEVFAEYPESSVLKVWYERLFFTGKSGSVKQSASTGLWVTDIGLVIILSLIAGTFAKLPDILQILQKEQFYMRNLGGIIIGALILYFCIQKRCEVRTFITILSLLLVSIVYINLLPGSSQSDSIILSCMHLPFIHWSLLSVAYLGGSWRELRGRMDYIRYNGELLIYTTVIMIGGMVLTGLTIALFKLIGMNIEKWYMNNVAVYGAIAAPIVATLIITRIIGVRFRISPLLARIFTPLFLFTVVVYLIAMVLNHKSPFSDRDFLIAFNGLLLIVIGLCVFSISERNPKKTAMAVDFLNISLVMVTLIIDVIALSAILFRLSSYGFTPNRVAVLGANLLAFCHLAGILYHYMRFVFRKVKFERIERWIVGYIPLYTVWSICVAAGFPFIFWFK